MDCNQHLQNAEKILRERYKELDRKEMEVQEKSDALDQRERIHHEKEIDLTEKLAMFETEKRILEDDRKNLAHEKEKWKIEEEALFSKFRLKDNVIKLKVGGEMFETYKTTLMRDPDSMLAIRFSGRHDPVTVDGAHFFDRDPKYFGHILNYLRDGNITAEILPRNKDDLYKILKEADYYELRGLKEEIEKIIEQSGSNIEEAAKMTRGKDTLTSKMRRIAVDTMRTLMEPDEQKASEVVKESRRSELDISTFHRGTRRGHIKDIEKHNPSFLKKKISMKHFEYGLENFPRIKYMHKMITCFERKLKKVENKLSFGEFLSERMEVKLYLPSDRSEVIEALLPPKKGTSRLEKDKASFWPDSVLVYIQGHNESLEQIEKNIRELQNTEWSSEIIVSHSGTQSVEKCTLTVVPCNKRSIQEAISKCLEASVSRYLEVKMSNLRNVKKESDRCPLEAEILSLQTILSTPSKPVKRIPKKIKDYLFGHPSVMSFAIWEGKTFRITVNDIACKDNLEQDLKALDLDGEFLQSHMLEILKGSVKVNLYVGQGDKLYPGHTINGSQRKEKCDAASNKSDVKKDSYGTLGAFMEGKNNRALYGITCSHVIPHEHEKVYMKIEENQPLSEFGQSVYTTNLKKPFEDFAVFKVNDHAENGCKKKFQNDDEYDCDAVVHTGNVSDNLIVHKKGATTGWTTGRIQSRECYSNLIPGQNDVFLVRGFDEDFFSLGGDSGSTVFKHDESFDQSTVSVLGMVFGGMESNYEDNRPEIEKSTMCVSLNDALNTMTESNGLELEFPSKEQSMGCDLDSD